MRHKWLILSILSLSLACALGYKLDSEQLRTSLMAAVRGGHVEAATMPEKIGSVSDDSRASLSTGVSFDNTGAANSLSEISFASQVLRASLIKAVKTDDTDLAKKLIKLGADANSRTSANGWSALHYAVRNGNPEIVQLLLKSGADPNCLGTMEGQANSTAPVKPLVVAEAALDLVSQVPPTDIENTLRQSGLNDPALMKSMKDPNATDRYRKVVEALTSASRRS